MENNTQLISKVDAIEIIKEIMREEAISEDISADVYTFIHSALAKAAVKIRNHQSETLVYDREQYEKGYQEGLKYAVTHSKWEISFDGYYPYCLECGYEPDRGNLTDFCPKCGSRMDGGKNA